MEDPIDRLLIVAKTYSQAAGVPLSVTSDRVLGDSRALPRLDQQVRTITVRNYLRAIEKLSEIWPTGVRWPAGIPRPKATPKAKVSAHES